MFYGNTDIQGQSRRMGKAQRTHRCKALRLMGTSLRSFTHPTFLQIQLFVQAVCPAQLSARTIKQFTQAFCTVQDPGTVAYQLITRHGIDVTLFNGR